MKRERERQENRTSREREREGDFRVSRVLSFFSLSVASFSRFFRSQHLPPASSSLCAVLCTNTRCKLEREKKRNPKIASYSQEALVSLEFFFLFSFSHPFRVILFRFFLQQRERRIRFLIVLLLLRPKNLLEYGRRRRHGLGRPASAERRTGRRGESRRGRRESKEMKRTNALHRSTRARTNQSLALRLLAACEQLLSLSLW